MGLCVRVCVHVNETGGGECLYEEVYTHMWGGDMCECGLCYRKTVFPHEPLEISMTGLFQALVA